MGAIKIENIYLRLQLKPQFVPILCPCIYLYKKKILIKKKKKKTHFCARAYVVCTLAFDVKYHLLIAKALN